MLAIVVKLKKETSESPAINVRQDWWEGEDLWEPEPNDFFYRCVACHQQIRIPSLRDTIDQVVARSARIVVLTCPPCGAVIVVRHIEEVAA